MRMLIILAALCIAACSPESVSTADETAPATAALAPAPAAPPRTGRLVDPSPMQVAALVGDWTGQPLDITAAAEAMPEYLNAPAADRDAVLARLVEAERARFEAAQGIGVLELNTAVANATYDPAASVYHLPVFLPGSTIEIAPGHRLRLSNAAAAYSLDRDSAVGQAMARTDGRPALVRLLARIDDVRVHGCRVGGGRHTGGLHPLRRAGLRAGRERQHGCRSLTPVSAPPLSRKAALRYNLLAWVDNLFDEEYFQSAAIASIVGASGYGVTARLGTPRTVGATLRVTF